MVKLLIAHGASIHGTEALSYGDSTPYSPWTNTVKCREIDCWRSAEVPDLAVVKLLLEQKADASAELEATASADPCGWTALHHAARNDDVELVAMLMQYGASINACDDTTMVTPLHVAAKFLKVRTIRVLLQHGANAAAKTTKGKRALTRLELALFSEGEKKVQEEESWSI